MVAIPQITSEEAWQMLVDNDDAVLVDVRTQTEWRTVGVPDLAELGRPVRFVSWTDESGNPNPHFLDASTDGLDPDTPILLLCRSGARSNAGAELLTASGFTQAHNIVGGFEGPRQPNGAHAGGWKDKLPSTDYHEQG